MYEKVRGRCEFDDGSFSVPDVVDRLDDANILDAPSLSVLEVVSYRDNKYGGKPRPG